jgi:hypothetical protein
VQAIKLVSVVTVADMSSFLGHYQAFKRSDEGPATLLCEQVLLLPLLLFAFVRSDTGIAG